MRIVSLLPSATEIVCALGLGDQLVGVTHACDYPADIVFHKPVVTSSLLSSGPRDPEAAPLSARAIDDRVRAARTAGESLYRIDLDRLRDLKPDLLLTQALCDVCAVAHTSVVAAVDALGSSARALNLEPTTLTDALQTIRQVGEVTGRDTEAAVLVARMRERFDRVGARAASAPERPRTLLLEWPDPPFSAGHWNPELLTLASGVPGPWDEVGKPSRTLTWEEIQEFAPEMLVLIACGFEADRAVDEAHALAEVPGWFDLPAVREGECYAVDGSAYFNRPGPRLAESAEILATILHPETFTEMLPPYAVRRFPNDLLTPERA